MAKRPLTPLGMQIKISLLNLNETQEWLISQAKEKTGMYVDSSNLYKLMTGQLHSKRLESAVREILNIRDEKTSRVAYPEEAERRYIMDNLIKIGDGAVMPKQYHGKRVVTFAEIDACHGRPEGTAGRNFRENRQHFIKDTDYFVVKPSDIQPDEIRRSEKSEIRTLGIAPTDVNNRGTTFITESGYLMLAKSFTDDLAWDVQRELVSYFEYGKNADKPSTSHTALKQRLLSSVNHEAELLRKSFEAAGIDPKFTAVHLANLYRAEVGQNIPALPIEVETTYDRTEIAKQLGVMTKSGSPHKDAIGAIIRKIGVDKSQIIHSSFSQNGHDGGYDRFKAPVLDKVRKWLDTAGWPNPIVLDKKYNVVYRSR